MEGFRMQKNVTYILDPEDITLIKKVSKLVKF